MLQALLDTDTDALIERLAPRVATRIVEMLTTVAPQGDDPLFRTVGAAAELLVSPSTMEGWRAKGIGPEWIRLGPKGIAYRKSALERFKRGEAAARGKSVK